MGKIKESISVLEISTLEMSFFVVFFFLIRRHINAAAEYKMPWRKAVYLPLRNLGLFFLLSLVPIIFIWIQQESFNFTFKYEKVMQLIGYIGVAICIYLAAPVDDKNKALSNNVDAPTKANT